MRRSPECNYTRAWHLKDGRFKCKKCNKRYSWISVWNVSRLPNIIKRKLLEYFACLPSALQSQSIEDCNSEIPSFDASGTGRRESFDGAIECDETMFGGHRRGKRGWEQQVK